MPRKLQFFGIRHAGYVFDSSVLNPMLGIGHWIVQHSLYIGARLKSDALTTAQELKLPGVTAGELRVLMGDDVEAMRAANLLQSGAVYAAAGTGSGSSKLVRALGRSEFVLVGEFGKLGVKA